MHSSIRRSTQIISKRASLRAAAGAVASSSAAAKSYATKPVSAGAATAMSSHEIMENVHQFLRVKSELLEAMKMDSTARMKYAELIRSLNGQVADGLISLNEAKMIEELFLIDEADKEELFDGPESLSALPSHSKKHEELYQLAVKDKSIALDQKLKDKLSDMIKNISETNARYQRELAPMTDMNARIELEKQRDEELAKLEEKARAFADSDQIPASVQQAVFESIEQQITKARQRIQGYFENKATHQRYSTGNFKAATDAEEEFIRIYTDRTRVQEQKANFAVLTRWFLAQHKERRKLFLAVLNQPGVQRTDIVKQLHTALINQRILTANSHIEMKRELAKDSLNERRAHVAAGSSSERGRDDDRGDERSSSSSAAATSGRKDAWEHAVFRHMERARYAKEQLKRELEYEEIKLEQGARESTMPVIVKSRRPVPLEKRFLRASTSGMSATGELLETATDKSLMALEANPYRYPFLNETDFKKQSLNLKSFVGGLAPTVAQGADWISRGSTVTSLLGDFENTALSREHPEGDDVDLELAAPMADAISGFEHYIFDKHEYERTNDYDDPQDDEVVRKFAQQSNAGHSYPYLNQHTLKVARNVVLKPGGRTESYSAIVMMGCPGFVGIGFGQANSPQTAEDKAKKIAMRNMRSMRVDPHGFSHQRVEGKFKRAHVVLTRNKAPGARGHPVLCQIAHYLGLENITIKVNGNHNILNVIPAFFNTLEKVGTVEQVSMATGQMPVHMRERTVDYRENMRADARQAFGFTMK